MNTYAVDIGKSTKKIYAGHLKMGGTNPKGDTVGFTNYYMVLNGMPFFPICGEFHYSRCDRRYWSDEIAKMKAAGINTVSTYVFWNHHEEDRGVFTWGGDKDLRYFIDLCAKHGMHVILRIGPFAHGEVRNGGFPDWLYGRPFTVRANDPEYLAYVELFFRELARQVEGQFFKDNGPIIGIQIENEHMHASPPWEFMHMKEYEWVGVGRDGAAHIREIKQLMEEAGMEAPLYTCTGWGGGSFLEDETLPVYGGYAFCPWYVLEEGKKHGPTNEYVIQNFHDNNFKCVEFDPPYPPEKYPYACSELGGGMACWYRYRFIVPPQSVEAATLVRVAGGCNFIGYYIFHDGTNPIGKHGYLNERNVPKISYHFQSPIGEYGQLRDSYKTLKPILYFLREYGTALCVMETAVPEGVGDIPPADNERLRYAVRHRDGEGFLFLINYQDHFEMKDHTGIRIRLNLPGESFTIPREGGLTLEKDVSAILPFNLDLGGVCLRYATAQLITSIGEKDARTYFFFAPEGMESEYCIDMAGVDHIDAQRGAVLAEDNYSYARVNPGKACVLTIDTQSGKRIRICTLTRREAMGFWKYELYGKERAVISEADILCNEGVLEARSTGTEIAVSVFPSVADSLDTPCGAPQTETEGMFQTFHLTLPRREVPMEVRRPSPDKAVIGLHPDAFDGLHEIFLHIDYMGNVGNAFIDGTLVSDNFCNGQIWEIGLKRLCPALLDKGMYFHIIPYVEGSDVVFDEDIPFRHPFAEDRTAEISDIRAVPQYRVLFTLRGKKDIS